MVISTEALVLSLICAIGGLWAGATINPDAGARCEGLTINELHQLEERYQACYSLMKSEPTGGETCRRLVYGSTLFKKVK